MEDKIKYSLMMLVEILVWLFFIKLAMINSDIFLITIIWTFFVGRHFTMYMDLIKEHPKVRGL